jgi:rSAM/selenodomain-associated transferase 1
MTPNARRPEAARIAVFAKAPVPGTVKTRLAGVLDPASAAALHAGLVRRALATAVESAAGAVELWCAPDEHHPFFAQCARDFGVALRRQEGADLGARMAGAFARTFGEGAALVIIGTDCPGLDARDLREAVRALRDADAVLAPAEDGGYVLVGLARPVASIFEAMPWGSAAVMESTRERLRHAQVGWREMRTFWDVDRPDDYARLQREGWMG